jgi:hypothetical protein
MDEQESFESQKKAVESDYTKYHLEKKIDELIKEKWQKAKWWIAGIISVVSFILTFYSIHISNVAEKYSEELRLLQQEREKIANQFDSKTQNIQNRLDSIQSKLALQSGIIYSQEKQLNLQDQTIAQSLNFSSLYSNLFKDQLQQTIQLRTNTERDINKFALLQKSIDSTIMVYNNKYNELNQLHESFKSQIEEIEKQNAQNTLNASIRYVYAERSDRNKETLLNAYKPSSIVLPNKLDTLTFIFYSAAKKSRANKTALIDVYIGKNKNNRSPIEINEINGLLTPSKINFSTPNESYIIEPVFLYFPPNIGGALIIPDFVVLKIRIKDSDDTN